MKRILPATFIVFLVLASFGCASEPAKPEAAPETPEETPSANPEPEGEVVASGTFEGRSDHVVSGGVSIVKDGDGYSLRLESDFSLDGAPDPKLGLGKDGYQASTQFSALESTTGSQSYKLPAEIDPGEYNEVWVWCQKFDVPLGVAKMQQ